MYCSPHSVSPPKHATMQNNSTSVSPKTETKQLMNFIDNNSTITYSNTTAMRLNSTKPNLQISTIWINSTIPPPKTATIGILNFTGYNSTNSNSISLLKTETMIHLNYKFKSSTIIPSKTTAMRLNSTKPNLQILTIWINSTISPPKIATMRKLNFTDSYSTKPFLKTATMRHLSITDKTSTVLPPKTIVNCGATKVNADSVEHPEPSRTLKIKLFSDHSFCSELSDNVRLESGTRIFVQIEIGKNDLDTGFSLIVKDCTAVEEFTRGDQYSVIRNFAAVDNDVNLLRPRNLLTVEFSMTVRHLNIETTHLYLHCSAIKCFPISTRNQHLPIVRCTRSSYRQVLSGISKRISSVHIGHMKAK